MSVRLSVLSGSILVFCVALIAGDATGQRSHEAGLGGEPPDTSNWPHPAAPDGNPYPRSTATLGELEQRDRKAQLGKVLFWDEQVSTDNTMACGTCHSPSAGGTDLRPGSVHLSGNVGTFGVVPQALVGGEVEYGSVATGSSIDRHITELNAPTMIGAYLFDNLFWDSRAGPAFRNEQNEVIDHFEDWAALEDLAVGPPKSSVEMSHEGMTWASGHLQAKLNGSFPLALVDPATVPADAMWILNLNQNYAAVFDVIFAQDPNVDLRTATGVTRERFAAAIAHYHRTLVPDQAPIDLGQMSPVQIQGFQIMLSEGCFQCHSASGSPALDASGRLVNPFDNLFSNGVSSDVGLNSVRKTPTLRNLALKQKFFSTGRGGEGGGQRPRVDDLSELIDFYLEPVPGNADPALFFQNGLSEGERLAVEDFLFHALTDPRVALEQGPFARPQLYSETLGFEDNEYGAGTPPTTGGLVPEIIANYPPLVPQVNEPSKFRVGVGDAAPLAYAALMISAFTAAPVEGSGDPLWVSSDFVLLPMVIVNANGIATSHYVIPSDPALVGVKSYAQWAILDNGVWSFSNAAWWAPL